jgi:hypothetical protein
MITPITLIKVTKIKQIIVTENDVDILKKISVLKINCTHFLNKRLF